MNKILLAITTCFIFGCNATSPVKNDPSSVVSSSKVDGYGYTAENPIKVGAFESEPRPHFNSNLRDYLSSLRGPNGEKVTYTRLGSCCHVDSEVAPYGKAPLDKYQVQYPGLPEPLIIYINTYDFEPPLAPEGLALEK